MTPGELSDTEIEIIEIVTRAKCHQWSRTQLLIRLEAWACECQQSGQFEDYDTVMRIIEFMKSPRNRT